MIAILQFTDEQGPGYLERYLIRRKLQYRIYRPDLGDSLPRVAELSGLALMGGTVEVNDPLPWIAMVISLIRQADQQSIPVIGHCLGGQLIARAFGAKVTNNHCYEIGWHKVDVLPTARQLSCFSGMDAFAPFHWHYQTFSLPATAIQLLSNQYCQNQAFQLRLNLAFQCHIEITDELVLLWCKIEKLQLEALRNSSSVQSEQHMLEDITDRLTSLHRVTEKIYDYWLRLPYSHTV